MTTDKTDTQMHPGIPNFQTILTAIGAWRDLTYLVKMTTGLCHLFLLSFFYENGSGRESHRSLHGLRVAFPASSGRQTPCRNVLFNRSNKKLESISSLLKAREEKRWKKRQKLRVGQREM
jgi:hypothetical protein